MTTRTVKSPSEILKLITSNQDAIRYDYIIMGRSGPTGKTWLYSKLKEFGYNVTEISEYIIGDVMWCHDDNRIKYDLLDRKVIIILNKPLERTK